MAASGSFIMLVLALALVPTLTTSKVFGVGDGQGWAPGVDYVAWAKGKDFQVGDKLLFNYAPGADSVFKVSLLGFISCSTTLGTPFTSGNDLIELTSAGPKWFVSGTFGHCPDGQKLAIVVRPASQASTPWSAPAPGPTLPGQMA